MTSKGLCAFADAMPGTATETARELALEHLRDDETLDHVTVILTISGKRGRDRVYTRRDFSELAEW